MLSAHVGTRRRFGSEGGRVRHNVLVPDACEGIGFSMASTNRETSHTMASCLPFTPRPFSGTVRLGGKSVLVRIDWDPSLHPHRTIAFRSPRSSGSPLPGQPRGSPSPPLVSPSDTRHVTGREENGGAGSFRRGENPGQPGTRGDPSATLSRTTPPGQGRVPTQPRLQKPRAQRIAAGDRMSRNAHGHKQKSVEPGQRQDVADPEELDRRRDGTTRKRRQAGTGVANETNKRMGEAKKKRQDVAATRTENATCMCSDNQPTDPFPMLVLYSAIAKAEPLSERTTLSTNNSANVPFANHNRALLRTAPGYTAVEKHVHPLLATEVCYVAALQVLLRPDVRCRPAQHPVQTLTDALYQTVSYAPASKCGQLCTQLLQRGALVISEDTNRSSLIAAVRRSKKCKSLHNTIEILLNQDKRILDWADPTGKTALHYAVEMDNLAATQMLLRAGANEASRKTDRSARPAYALSVEHGRYYHIVAMLKSNPELDIQNLRLLSSLLESVKAGNLDNVPYQTSKLLTLMLSRGKGPLRESWKSVNTSVLVNEQFEFERNSLQCNVLQILWLYRYVQIDAKTCHVQNQGSNVCFPHIRWSKSTHHLFPAKFKESVRTLLLCFHRAKHAHGNREWSVLQIILPLFVWKHAYGDWIGS